MASTDLALPLLLASSVCPRMSLVLLPIFLAISKAVLIPQKQIEYLSQPGKLFAGGIMTVTDLGTVPSSLKDLVANNILNLN